MMLTSLRPDCASAAPPDALVVIESCFIERCGAGSSNRGFGAGFFISADGLLATAYHVIYQARQVTIWDKQGQQYNNVEVVSLRPDVDVALLRVNAVRPLPFIELDDRRPSTTEPLQLFGHPVGNLHFVASATAAADNIRASGFIAAGRRILLPNARDFDVLPIQATAYRGASGGPVVASGRAVALLSGGIAEGGSFFWSIPAKYVMDARREARSQSWPSSASWPPLPFDSAVVGNLRSTLLSKAPEIRNAEIKAPFRSTAVVLLPASNPILEPYERRLRAMQERLGYGRGPASSGMLLSHLTPIRAGTEAFPSRRGDLTVGSEALSYALLHSVTLEATCFNAAKSEEIESGTLSVLPSPQLSFRIRMRPSKPEGTSEGEYSLAWSEGYFILFADHVYYERDSLQREAGVTNIGHLLGGRCYLRLDFDIQIDSTYHRQLENLQLLAQVTIFEPKLNELFSFSGRSIGKYPISLSSQSQVVTRTLLPVSEADLALHKTIR